MSHRQFNRHLGRSRYRKAGVMDAIGVALLLAFSAAMGCILVLLSAPSAKADTSDALAYATIMAHGASERLFAPLGGVA